MKDTSTAVKIDIGTYINSNLFIRSTAIDLFMKIETLPAKSVIIDFKNVNFMNRAFAHEYLTQTLKCKKEIIEINLSDDVKLILSAVRNYYLVGISLQ